METKPNFSGAFVGKHPLCSYVRNLWLGIDFDMLTWSWFDFFPHCFNLSESLTHIDIKCQSAKPLPWCEAQSPWLLPIVDWAANQFAASISASMVVASHMNYCPRKAHVEVDVNHSSEFTQQLISKVKQQNCNNTCRYSAMGPVESCMRRRFFSFWIIFGSRIQYHTMVVAYKASWLTGTWVVDGFGGRTPERVGWTIASNAYTFYINYISYMVP